jgi:hypothetical protein
VGGEVSSTSGAGGGGEGADASFKFTPRVPVSESPFTQPADSVRRSEVRTAGAGRYTGNLDSTRPPLSADEEAAAIIGGWSVSLQ